MVFKTWLVDHPAARRDGVEVVEVVAMDALQRLQDRPDRGTPRRVRHYLHSPRGRRDEPLYRARRTLYTGASLLTQKQTARMAALFAGDEHLQGEASRAIYQAMVTAYREPGRGRVVMTAPIEDVSSSVPAALTESITLGRTLKNRGADFLVYFDRPGASNGPTEAINSLLERPRSSGPGFSNRTNYIARSLLETADSARSLTLDRDEPRI